MTSIADQKGMGAVRRVQTHPDGTLTVFVKPPRWVGDYPEQLVHLDTPAKVAGYNLWSGGDYIQCALHMLNIDEREILLNGGVSKYLDEDE